MRTYCVYVIKADGTEISLRKRGANEGDAVDRAVSQYPRCRVAWAYLDVAARVMRFGRGECR